MYNYKLGYLRAIAIILVVVGHSNDGGINLLFNWFPIYSFHIPLLIFVSGYFYDDTAKVFSYIKKRFKRLVIPYYQWNLFYAVVFFAVTSIGLLGWKYTVNLQSFFVEPWFSGEQYVFNLAAWFVLSLFLMQLANILVRKALGKFKIANEYLLFIISLVLGLVATYMASLGLTGALTDSGYTTSVYTILGRTLFGLPFLQLGYLYRTKLEKHDKPSIKRLTLLFAVQLGLLLFYGNLGYFVEFMSFSGRIVQPFLSSFTGIYLCLQISAVLAERFSPNKLLRYIGDNSWTIMINHIFGFWLLNTLFYLLNANGFDKVGYITLVYYKYQINNVPQTLILFVLVGIFFPLALSYGLRRLRFVLFRRRWEKFV